MHKKVIVLPLVLMMVFEAVSAQGRGMFNDQAVYVEKGTKSVGLSFGYNRWDASGDDGIELFSLLSGFKGNVTVADFSANGSWFVKDDMSVGVRLGYDEARMHVDSIEFVSVEISDRHYLRQAFNGSVTCRKYIPLFSGNILAMFVEGRLSGKIGYVKGYENTVQGKEGSYGDLYEVSAGCYPGVSVFVTDSFSFEMMLPFLEGGYNWQKQNGSYVEDGTLSHSFFSFKPNLVGLRVGLLYYF